MLSLLAGGLRQEDINEWVAGTGQDAHRGIIQCFRNSALSRVILFGEVPLCTWGILLGATPDVRHVWFAAAAIAPRHAIAIHRHFRAAVFEMQPPGASLVADTYWRNNKHHRWLEAHGFHLGATLLSPIGIPYHRYVRPPPQ